VSIVFDKMKSYTNTRFRRLLNTSTLGPQRGTANDISKKLMTQKDGLICSTHKTCWFAQLHIASSEAVLQKFRVASAAPFLRKAIIPGASPAKVMLTSIKRTIKNFRPQQLFLNGMVVVVLRR
jgi:hypothetical protein